MILEQHQTGGLELLGQMWSWVSGESLSSASLIGQWFSPIECHGNADRIDTAGNADRIDTAGNADRIECFGN